MYRGGVSTLRHGHNRERRANRWPPGGAFWSLPGPTGANALRLLQRRSVGITSSRDNYSGGRHVQHMSCEDYVESRKLLRKPMDIPKAAFWPSRLPRTQWQIAGGAVGTALAYA